MRRSKNMSTNKIADIIIKDLSGRSFPVFLTSFAGAGFHEADVLGINSNGYMYEFEIKRSRSDFLADFKNKQYKHKRLNSGDAVHIVNEWKNGKKTGNKTEKILIPNKFFFVCESNIIKANELPDYCGLIYVGNNSFTEIKKAKFIHKNKANQQIYERAATILSQRIIYGCSYYTYKQKSNKQF